MTVFVQLCPILWSLFSENLNFGTIPYLVILVNVIYIDFIHDEETKKNGIFTEGCSTSILISTSGNSRYTGKNGAWNPEESIPVLVDNSEQDGPVAGQG